MSAASSEALYGPWDMSAREAVFPYDDTPTYAIAANWVDDQGRTVEDWGCGGAWLSREIVLATYRGIDGAAAPWVDEQVDLRTYTSHHQRATMRHVLEHNLEWRTILANFLASWSERASLVTFVPFRGEFCKHKVCPGDEITDLTIEVDHGIGEWAVPDLHLPREEFLQIISDAGVTVAFSGKYETTSQYGTEEVFHLSR